MPIEITVPTLGESITEATILEWLVQPGDAVTTDQDLVALETDKVTINVPSPASGVLVKQLAEVGAEVEVGSVLGSIDENASADKPSAASPPAASAKEAESAAETQQERPEVDDEEPQSRPRLGRRRATTTMAPAEVISSVPMMPAVRRLVAKHMLDTTLIKGTGRGGRILKEDVLAYLDTQKQPSAAAPAAPAPKAPARPEPAPTPKTPPSAPVAAGDLERVVPMSRLRQRIAANLVQAQQSAALLTTFNELDMAAVMALRKSYQDLFTKKYGIKLGFMSFFAKAAIEALKAFPGVNAEVRGTDIVYKDHYDIGIAVGGGRGLVVPVIRDADKMSLADFELALAAMALKAKNNQLAMDDLVGGTFTISNGGVYGSMLSTPILNPPQSGILGLHKIEKRAVVINDSIVVRPMMYVALTYDHRIVDGKEAVGFLVRIKEIIEDPNRLIIEV